MWKHSIFKRKEEKNYKEEGGNRVWTGDLSICSRMLYHWAMPPLMRWDVPLKLFIIRCNFSSFSLAKSQPRDLQIMVYSCAMSPNFAWRQIIFCCRVYETTLFSFLLSQSCVKMADRFASQRYSLKIKLGDRMKKHQYSTQLSQNIVMMNQVVHGKGQRNERFQGRGLRAWVAHLY